MKKLLLFAIGATTMMASCSNEDAEFQQQGEGLTPIELSATVNLSVNTKAPLTGTAFENSTEITVLGLAKQIEGMSPAGWTGVENLAFGAETGNGIVGTVTEKGIEFDKLYYYPINQTSPIEYTFIASYPASTWVTEAEKTSKAFNVDGCTDYLYACAEVDGGYNAKYFRTEGAEKPMLKFDHLMTLLRFHLKPGEGEGISADDLDNTIVTKIEVLSMPKDVTLSYELGESIADTKKISATATTGNNITAFSLSEGFEEDYAYTNEPASEITVYEQNAVPFGYVIVPPTSIMPSQSMPAGGKGYKIRVSFKKAENEQDEGENEVQTAEADLVYADGFEAGKAYDINLKIYGYRQIGFETPQITPWEDVVIPEENPLNGGIDINE